MLILNTGLDQAKVDSWHTDCSTEAGETKEILWIFKKP
jgi:hypothetical protein